LQILWRWAKEVELNPEEWLPAQTWNGFIPFQLAASNNHVETLGELWFWAKGRQLHLNELKKKLLLRQDKNRFIALHHAAKEGCLVALETLWSWAKEAELNTDEMLLARKS
jgi:hypothetical protein